MIERMDRYDNDGHLVLPPWGRNFVVTPGGE